MKNLLMITSLILASSAFAATESEPSVIVNGNCTKAVMPDLVEIDVGVRLRDPDAQNATSRAASTYEKLLKKVKSLNLHNAEIETTTMRVQRITEYVKDHTVDRGYEATYAFNVRTTDMSRIGEIIKAANSNGANEVEGPRPMLSKTLRKKEYETCLAEAVTNARAKAETIAQSLGVKLSGKAIISESGSGVGQPVYREFKSQLAADAAPTVEMRRQDIQVDVSGTFFVR